MLRQSVETPKDIPHFPGELVLERLGRPLHAVLHRSPDRRRAAPEDLQNLVDHGSIVGFGLKTGARRLAASDVVVETGSRR